jgi:Holliday junction resolvase RusA-like endonuclease
MFSYPHIPPSINSAYKINRKTGAFYMDAKSKVYKDAFQIYARENWLEEINNFDTDSIYHLNLNFLFKEEELVNLDFGINKRRKKKYKRVDTDNLVKLMKDCIAKAFGFDDSQIFTELSSKIISDTQGVEFSLVKLSPNEIYRNA